ncbi:MAG: peptidoglycan-binding protein [bacterium]|nr:peptidoglycan-binding protein [bacterium]
MMLYKKLKLFFGRRSYLTEVRVSLFHLKLLLVLFFFSIFLLPSVVSATNAVRYIDPTCATPGNGTSKDCNAGASAPLATWPASNSFSLATDYLQKAGTSVGGICGRIINTAGTAKDPIILGSYGVGAKPQVVCPNSNYVFAVIKGYNTIRDLELTAGQYCIYNQPNTDTAKGVLITNNKFTSCVTGATIVDTFSVATRDWDDFTFSNNEVVNSGPVITFSINNSNTSTYSNQNIVGNNIHDCRVSTGWALGEIAMPGDEPSAIKFDTLNISNNTFTDCKPGGIDIPVYMIRFSWHVSSNVYSAHRDRITNLSVTGNTFTNINGGIWITHTYGDNQRSNVISNNTIKTSYGNAAISLFYNKNMTISGNIIDTVIPISGSSFIDGMGIDIDFYNTSLLVENNKISNTLGHPSVIYSGQCIYWAYAVPPGIIRNNICENNKFGLHLQTNQDTNGGSFSRGVYDPLYVYNNTIINPSTAGIYLAYDSRSRNKIWNNVVINALTNGSRGYCRNTYGAGASVVQDLRSNIFYNNLSNNYVVGNLGSGAPNCSFLSATSTNSTEAPQDIYSNPYLGMGGRITSSVSSVIDAGVNVSSLSGRTTDIDGAPIYGTDDIGAFEYQPPYQMGARALPIGGSFRVYKDGKYRMTAATSSSVTANLSIAPTGGFSVGDYGEWADIHISNWNMSSDFSKSWTEKLFVATPLLHTIGDLAPNGFYTVKIDGLFYENIQADAGGQAFFVHANATSTHTIDVAPDPSAEKNILLPAPSNLSATPLSSGHIKLEWSSVSGVNIMSYGIYRNSALIASVAGTAYDDVGLTPSTVYTYAVVAMGTGTTSPRSAEVSVTTLAFMAPTSSGGSPSSPSVPVSPQQNLNELPLVPQKETLSLFSPTLPPSIVNILPSPVFPHLTGPFGIGMNNAQVRTLQEILKHEGSFTGEATGYYGTITQKAVETFQTKYNLVTTGSPSTTGYGLAGPATRAKLNSLYASTSSAQGAGGGGSGGISTDREALLASLRKQVEELIKILQGLIAKLAAIKAGERGR